ncbi:MAG: glycosyltransferase family 2 protein [bacterium]|nr:glycosyltransferase family 2 protein [bacterium]
MSETEHSERGGGRPRLTVVLPVRNEERFIADTLAQLQRQEFPRDDVEFLVCDGYSDDRTREIVRELAAADPRIRLLDNPGRRSSAGRNVGFRAARGEFVLVIDGHVQIPDGRLLANVVRRFDASGADCLGRPQPLIAEPGQPWAEAIVLARAGRLGHSPESFIYSDYEGFASAASMGAAYRRSVFDRIGYVDESFDACEDLEFNTRVDAAGLRCFTATDLTVRYYARNSPRALFKQLFRYGFGRYRYLRRHPRRTSPGQLVPAALVAGFAALPLLIWLLPPIGWIDLGLVSLYLLAVFASAAAALRHGVGAALRMLVVIPTIHFATGIGFLSSMLRGARLGRGGTPVGGLPDTGPGRDA